MLIKNAILVKNNQDLLNDIEINNGIITKIKPNIDGVCDIDAKGQYLFPAIIDLNASTLDDKLSGNSLKDLKKDAQKGGVTNIVMHPFLEHIIADETSLEFINSNNFLHSGISIEVSNSAHTKDDNLSNISILLKSGAIAPTLKTAQDHNIIMRTLEYCKMYNIPLFCILEDKALEDNGVMNESKMANKLGLAPISILAETIQIAKMIEFSKQLNVSIIFKGVSTKRGLELILNAKRDGIKVQSEVSILHLSKTDSHCENYNTQAKIKPPLRSSEDIDFLTKALKNNDIDLLTSLHSPKSYLNKDTSFDDASFGTSTIDILMPLYYTYLIKTNIINYEQLFKLVASNPANIIKKNSGKIEVGYQANLILFNKDTHFIVENTKSLYYKEKLFGEVTSVIKMGKLL